MNETSADLSKLTEIKIVTVNTKKPYTLYLKWHLSSVTKNITFRSKIKQPINIVLFSLRWMQWKYDRGTLKNIDRFPQRPHPSQVEY